MVVFNVLMALSYALVVLWFVYMHRLTQNKLKALVTPNPNIPWTETYSVFTLIILKCLCWYIKTGIIKNTFELVFIVIGPKYGEWIVPTDFMTCSSTDEANYLYQLNWSFASIL